MLVKLTKIGNSHGIRLPKSVIAECGFQSEINLTVEQKRVILTAQSQDRAHWREKIHPALNEQQNWQSEWIW